ncbi:hypothetical protein KBD33_00100 [Candidatus Gracilibacteria bacterium]|nr:hypothetical protein [Candidatus Gracilibacteria bacterium]
MMNFLTKLAQKPTDKAIRITRVIFALVLLLVIYFGWNVTVVNFGLPDEVKYGFYTFPLIGLVRGILDPGIFRKKIWKWTIVTLGSFMLLTSLILIDDTEKAISNQEITVSGEIRMDALESTEVPFSLSTDNWFGFFGFILVIIGLVLNNKNITLKNERYGEKVTKIRV